MNSFKKEVLRLGKKNRNVVNASKILNKKSVRVFKEVDSYLNSKGFSNKKLAIRTLQYIDFNIERFSVVDADVLNFLIIFTFGEDLISFDSNNYTNKQLRELNKLSAIDRKIFTSASNWQEIKIRSSLKDVKTNAEVFVKIKEQIMGDYIKYLQRKL